MTSTTLRPNNILAALTNVFRFSKNEASGLYVESLDFEPQFDEVQFERELDIIRSASGLIQDELWHMDSYSYQAGYIEDSYVAVVKWANASDFELYVDHIQFDSVSEAARYIGEQNA